MCGLCTLAGPELTNFLGCALFGVALGTQPVDAAPSIQPLINFGFALETLDDPVINTRKLGQDLPVIVGNSKHLERHSLLCHAVL